MRFSRKSNKVMLAVLCIAVIVLVGTVTVLAIQLNRTTTATLPGTAYAVGTLDESGKVAESKENIYTKDLISVDGLKITVKEKADVQYKLYFYDADKAFVSASEEWLTADFEGTIPDTAKYVRVVIDPIEDNEVSVFEVFGYANQLTVTYNK